MKNTQTSEKPTAIDLMRDSVNNDPLVSSMVENYKSHEEIIAQLIFRHQNTIKELEELYPITPRAILKDGKLLIWRCPDALVPLIETNPLKL